MGLFKSINKGIKKNKGLIAGVGALYGAYQLGQANSTSSGDNSGMVDINAAKASGATAADLANYSKANLNISKQNNMINPYLKAGLTFGAPIVSAKIAANAQERMYNKELAAARESDRKKRERTNAAQNIYSSSYSYLG